MKNDIVKIKEGDLAKVLVDAYLKKKQFKELLLVFRILLAVPLTSDQVTNFKVKIKF
jgi:HlyD family secretion protein